MMVWVLYTIIGVLASLLGLSIYYNLKFGRIILNIQDSVEESLDVLDERYKDISKICQIELWADSPEIRRVHKSLKDSRDEVLRIADVLCGGLQDPTTQASNEEDSDDIDEG